MQKLNRLIATSLLALAAGIAHASPKAVPKALQSFTEGERDVYCGAVLDQQTVDVLLGMKAKGVTSNRFKLGFGFYIFNVMWMRKALQTGMPQASIQQIEKGVNSGLYTSNKSELGYCAAIGETYLQLPKPQQAEMAQGALKGYLALAKMAGVSIPASVLVQ